MEKKSDEDMKKPEGTNAVFFPETKKISMWLDDYNDIFSDFDPRDYSERALSDDFLNESQKMFREKKSGKLELSLLVPQILKKPKEEAIIIKRLKEFFKGREMEERLKINRTIRGGVILTIIGFILMIFATFLYYYETELFILKFLIVLFEPAGWFSVWYGLDKIFYTAADRRKNYAFFKKISEADIYFLSY